MRTETAEYADRLVAHSGMRWKRLLNVQAPYQWNIKRNCSGRTLEVGCGIGRNLGSLSADSVGVDHNEVSVRIARERGFNAVTVADFFASELSGEAGFDNLLVAHVLEHLPYAESVKLMQAYLPCVRPGGRVFVICPQERGFASDPTHVTWLTGEEMERLSRDLGIVPSETRSFPFPRLVGRFFRYNEFTLASRKP